MRIFFTSIIKKYNKYILLLNYVLIKNKLSMDVKI